MLDYIINDADMFAGTDTYYGEIGRTRTFEEIFPSADAFTNATVGTENTLISSLIPNTLTPDKMTMLYYMLFAQYGVSHIASRNEDQWKLDLFSRIYQYGGIWQKKLYMRDNLLALSDAELRKGGRDIYNHASNPSTAPSTATLHELPRIDDQNTTNRERSTMDAYAMLMSLLDEDITRDFLKKFENMFLKFLGRDYPLGYYNAKPNTISPEV